MATRSNASRRGSRTPGLSGGDLADTLRVFLGNISEINCALAFSQPARLFLALRCPKEIQCCWKSRLKTERQNICWRDALLLTSIMTLPSRCVFPSFCVSVGGAAGETGVCVCRFDIH